MTCNRCAWAFMVPIILAFAGPARAVETVIDVDTANVNRSAGDTLWFDSTNGILSDGAGTIGLDTINGSAIPAGFMEGWAHTQWSFLKYDDATNKVAEITAGEKETVIGSADATDDYYTNGANTTISADQAIGWVETNRDFIIDNAVLDVAHGGLMFHGPSHWVKSIAGGGFLTSSSGELAIVANGGSTDYQVNNVVIKDFDGITPLTLVKTGGDHLQFDAANTYTGGTVINNGRLQAGNVSAYGTGDVIVDGDNGQAWAGAAGTYNNNFIIGGDGWAEGAGQLGAIRMGNGANIAGMVTFTKDARIGADGTATISGAINGGEFGLKKAWNGTLVVESTGNTMGKTSVLQGILRIADQTSLGATPGSPVADQITLSGGGKIMGGTSGAGVDLTLDANRGITLVNNSGFHVWTGFTTTVEGDITGTGRLDKTDGGKLVLNGDVTNDGGLNFNSGAAEINGNVNVGGHLQFGTNIVVDFNGTTVTSTGGLRLWNSTINLNADTVDLALIRLGEGSGQTGHVVQTKGDVSVSGDLRLGHWSNNTSTYTMQGGTLTLTGTVTSNTNENQSVLFLGIDGTGVFNLEGGTVTVPAVTLDNRGNTAGIDTLAVTGGTLNVGNWGINARNSSYLIEFGGGTIGATDNWSTSGDVTLTGTNGDTIFDPGTYTITMNGPLTGAGGLVKNGPGNLVLSGVNTYTGTTVVNGGTLLVNAAHGIPYTVANGGALGGTGTISNTVTVQSGGAIKPGEIAAPGTLTIDTVDLQNGSESTYRTGTGGDQLTVAAFDGLNVGAGPGDTHTINIGWAAAPATGTYALIDYDGAIGGAGFDGFQLGPSHITANLENNVGNTSIEVNVTEIDSEVVWTGNVNSAWDVATTQNWKLLSDSSATKYLQYDQVNFNDAAPTGSINLSGVITPTSVEIDNSAVAYTFTGAGIGGGVTTLTKDGTGSLTLLNDNTYGGATVVNEGTLVVGNGTTGHLPNTSSVTLGTTAALELNLPDGATMIASIVNPTTVTLTGSNDFTLSGVFTGGGNVVMNGTGTVTMTNGNHMITNIEINSGTLQATGGHWTRSFFGNQAGRSITINDGGKLMSVGTHDLGGLGTAFYRPLITINEGGVWELNREQYWSGNHLDMTGGLVNILVNDLRLEPGTVEVGASSLPSQITGNQMGLYWGDATFQVADGDAAEDLIVSAPVAGSPGLTKTGPGVMVASGNNTYTGTTNVNEGTLLVNGTHVGGGQYTVASGATLGGTGTITPAAGSLISVQSGGGVAPGENTGESTGTLNVTGDFLEMSAGSIYEWGVGQPDDRDMIAVVGGLTLTDGWKLTIDGTNGLITVDESVSGVDLFTATGTVDFNVPAITLIGGAETWIGTPVVQSAGGRVYLTGLFGGGSASLVWKGGIGDWSDAAKWNPDGPPAANSQVTVATADAEITIGAAAEAMSLDITAGTVDVQSTLDAGTVTVEDGGTLVVDGTLTAEAGSVAGTLAGNGTIDLDPIVVTGTVAPGTVAPGMDYGIGKLTIAVVSELAFGPGATYNAEVSLGDGSATITADKIVVSKVGNDEGGITLNGTLAPNGVGRTKSDFFKPSVPLMVVDNTQGGILEGVGATSREFAAVDPDPENDAISHHIGQGAFLRGVTYPQAGHTTAVEISVVVALEGDTDGDGLIGLDDWDAFRANFGSSGADWTRGNFDPWSDDIVDLDDWDIFRSRFGQTYPIDGGGAAAAAVPEPGTIVMLLGALAGLVLIVRRRRAA